MWQAKDGVRTVAKHVTQYGIGYGIAGFLAIAAATCGFCAGREGTVLFSSPSLSIGVLLTLLREGLAVLALLLFAMHPFGCALCAALLASRAFSVGLTWGAWISAQGWAGALPFALLLLPQGLLSLAAWCAGCCVTAYAALRVTTLHRNATLWLLAAVWVAQALALALRCLALASLS